MRTLALCLALCIVAGCASHEPAARTSARTPASAHGHPRHIVVAGRTLVLSDGGPIRTAFAVARDPRALEIRYEIDRADGNTRPACAPLIRPFAYIESETATTVTVGIEGYRTALKGHGVELCSALVAGYRRLPVRLRAPLGRRIVRDADFNDPVQIISERSVPIPGYLPSGYEPRGVVVMTLSGPARTYRKGGYVLNVIVALDGDYPSRPGRPNATVRGNPATVTVGADFSEIEWTSAQGRRYAVQSSPAPDRNSGYPGDRSPLTRDQLQRVADSLP
jgi:hypothetical protein